MTATERWLATVMLTTFIALLAWLMATVSINSGRISVLERRADNYHNELKGIQEALSEHRNMTELKK